MLFVEGLEGLNGNAPFLFSFRYCIFFGISKAFLKKFIIIIIRPFIVSNNIGIFLI